MRPVMIVILISIYFALQSVGSAQQDTSPDGKNAILRVKFEYVGKAVSLGLIDGSRDPKCANCTIPDDRLIVDDADGSIKNVVLIWDERKNKEHLPREFAKVANARIEIEHKQCRLQPHIVVVRVGQEVAAFNRDETGHGANFHLFNNTPSGLLVPVGEPHIQKFEKSEPAPLPVECNVHPWERAYLVVKEHPFVGISDAKGVIEIADLPVGINWFKIWHESSTKSFEYVDLNGVNSPLVKGAIQFKLEPGVNDLGTIKLDEKQFSIR